MSNYKACDILDNLENQYLLLEKIGDDAFSKVYYAKRINSNEKLSIKVLDGSQNDELKKEKDLMSYYEVEKNALRKINNKNVIKLYDCGIGNIKDESNSIKEESKYYFVLEYAEKNNLFDYLRYPEKGFGENISKYLCKEIINGLSAIHKAGIAHRNLKLENILLSDKYEIKISDFGFSIETSKKAKTYLQTQAAYKAPEIKPKNIKVYDGKKADIFAFGVILFCLVTGDFPFGDRGDIHRNRIYRLIVNQKDKKSILKEWDKTRKIKSENFSNEFFDLFFKLVAFNPDERPTVDDILNDPWMTKNFPSKNEVENELMHRDDIIRSKKESQMTVENSSDSEDDDRVYKGLSSDDCCVFGHETQIKNICCDDSSLVRNSILIKGKLDPYKFMNKFYYSIKSLNEENVNLQFSKKHLKFFVMCENVNEDEEKEEEEDDNMENANDDEEGNEEEEENKLIVKIVMFQVKDKNNYMIVFTKKSGEQEEFYQKVKSLKELALNL